MKIECIKDKLSTNISLAEKITRKNVTLPVLNSLLLESKKNNLIIRSTNLDLAVEIVMPVKVLSEGVVAVPGTVLNSLINSLQGDKNITLELLDDNLIVSTNHNKAAVKVVDHSEFPLIPKIEGDSVFKINTKDFVKGIRSVWYSSGTSSVKPELSSVYIYNDNDFIYFVSTDSFRLAEKKLKVKKGKPFPSFLLPSKNVPEISSILENSDEEIDVVVGNGQISFKTNGVYLISRVIDGTFPDYKQVLPKEFKTEAIVLKQDLVNSFKTVNIFSDSFNQVNFDVRPSEKKFKLNSNNNDIGKNTNNLDTTLSGQDLEMNFNYKYIVDCFQSIESDSVSLNFSGPNKPMVMQGLPEKSFTYLVMPMNK